MKIKENIYSITRRIIAIKKANGLLKILLYLIFCIPVLPFIVFTFILGVISYLNEKVEKLLDYLDDLVYTAGRFMIDKISVERVNVPNNRFFYVVLYWNYIPNPPKIETELLDNL